MKFERSFQLHEIAAILECEFVGPASHEVTGMNEIHVVDEGDIVFVDHPKYYDRALQSKATTILINKKVEPPEGKALLLSNDPFRDFNTLTRHFNSFQASSASISESASIGKNSIIQPNCFIGKQVKIGDNCVIHSNVSIYDHCEIGDNCTIHANTVIGADAFYYKKRADGFDKLLSGGKVVLANNVDLGASCTIDRGVSGITYIGEGSKLDNNVHIGHDTKVGRKCLFASQVGIAGCVNIEDEVTLWGQVGITSDVTIGKKAVILAQSGVSKSLEGGKVYFGTPAEEARKKYREMAAVKNLPELLNGR